MAGKMKFIDMASWILCTIAALHLGIIGVFKYNVVEAVFGTATNSVYIIIGLFALPSVWHMFTHKK